MFTFIMAYIHSIGIFYIIMKFQYNARSDWLKQSAFQETDAPVDDGKLAFKFLLRSFDKFDPNYLIIGT